MRLLRNLITVAAASGLMATSAAAQGSGVMIEGHGGIALPTFDIADAADLGPVFGAGLWYQVAPRVNIGVEADFGFHSGADVAGVSGPDVNVYHFMAKGGYEVYNQPDSRVRVMLNAGLGLMMFDVDVTGFDTETYFAINAGAKIYIMVADQVDVVISPQGDIAFSDKDVIGTDNAWVWPLTAGINFRI